MKTRNIHSQISLLASKKSFLHFFGNFRSPFLGKSMEFHDFSSYEFGDDAKNIDWLASKREGKILVRRYQEEKQGNVVFALCLGENFTIFPDEKFQVLKNTLSLLDTASQKSLLHLRGYVFGSTAKIIENVKGKNIMVPKILESLGQFHTVKPFIDTKLLLSPFQKPALLFIFIDTLDIPFQDMSLLTRKHDVVFVHIASHFENTLEANGEFFYAFSGKTSYVIESFDQAKQEEYKKEVLQEKKDFAKKCHSLGAYFVSLDEKSDILQEFLLLTYSVVGKK